MEVVLYIYDLSKIDAIYHTSLVFGGIEYYYGKGIQQSAPGATHHGEPMKKMHLGTCHLPMDVIIEYMESLAQSYTEEVRRCERSTLHRSLTDMKDGQSYDLFLRNCNNFTNDLAMFLVGTGIPEEIRNLPEIFLRTPFGQMMRPYIENMMRPVTQGGESLQVPQVQTQTQPRTIESAGISTEPLGKVLNVSDASHLESLLQSASSKCAIIFFTSATCPPCKICYPIFDKLAERAGDKAFFIKVDISQAYGIAMKYNVRATPTFITFTRGEKENEWSGANPHQLTSNVKLLLEMTYPAHSHTRLRVPSLHGKVGSYVLFQKVPPLEKLLQKISEMKDDPAIQDAVNYLRGREMGPASNALPNLQLLRDFVANRLDAVPFNSRFAVTDIIRCIFADSKVSGFFAEEADHKTVTTLLSQADSVPDCPYALRLVLTQLACNQFSSPVYPTKIFSSSALRESCIRLATSSMLDSHSTLRTAAVSLIYNLASYNHNARLDEKPDPLSEIEQVELAASLIESIGNESESVETLHGLLLSLGMIVYCAPVDSEVLDLCRAMEASNVVLEKAKTTALAREPLITEIGQELLAKGLARP
ncbi:hypothetical protein KEM56_000055 [Ascosphaera pollenicola]|nr:hypothetical protein KEM56_000055 [Ascosphaera pollenicola]